MDIKNSSSSDNLSINTRATGSNSGGSKNMLRQNYSQGKGKENTLLDRLNAIDARYKYNTSLTDLFNRMDANLIA